MLAVVAAPLARFGGPLSCRAMQRFALGLAVWSALLLTISGLAMLARPEVGPPMPRSAGARTAIDALVPVSEVERDDSRRAAPVEERPRSVAPRSVEPPATPDERETPAPAPAKTGEPVQPPADPRAAALQRDGGIPGLGPLPPGVPAEEEGFGLHVVRPDGRPAHDAQVRWMLRRDLEAERAAGRDPTTRDPADVLAAAPNATRANSAGFAMLTSEAGPMLVEARLGDQYGWLRVQREDTGHARIVLARDSTLDVLAVDAQGAPRAGVPVVLRDAACAPIWSARTDSEGRARLRHADGAVLAARARHDDLSVAVDVPGGEARVLARGVVPDDAVRLAAPAGQRVLVWVRDADAKPCARPTRVRLALQGREGDCAATRERTAVDGLAVFEDVPAGLSLVARVDSACSPEPLRVELVSRPDAETNVVVAATARMPRVTGRLLDPRGGPWRQYDVEAFHLVDDAWIAQGAQRTDDRGAFEIDVPALHAHLARDAGRPFAISLVARNRYGRTIATAELELTQPRPDGLVELGDVAAIDWPVLVRGGVLDENERAMDGALVELCDAQGRPDPRTRTTSDERGQFTLRGPAPEEGDALLVRATEPERRAADATIAVRRGDSRARVVIAIHGRLEGSVLLPTGAPDASVIVRVEQATGAQLALSVDAAGSYSFSNVEPGEARIAFVVQGFDDEPVFELDRVVIPRGGACTDPRVVGTDLRELLAVVELEVVDERGLPLESGWIGPVSEGRPRGRGYSMEDGVARVVIARHGGAIQVSADGYEPVVLPSPLGRVRVAMKPSGG